MPPQGKSKGPRRNDGASSAAASDPRFASMTSDPRFRLPSARQNRVGVDKRFSRMFKDEDFSKKASVDRYGRKVDKGNAKKELERFYKIEDGEEEEEDEEEEREVMKGRAKKVAREVVGSDEESEEEEAEVADDSEVEKELKRLDSKVRDPAREGGFSSSEDESSSEEESEDEEEAEEDAVDFPNEQAAEVPTGEVSARLAVVNLDWDNIRATDIMAVAQSFIPVSGRISQVVVYPSEFGRERMEKEELEGPPRDIFASTRDDGNDDEDSEDEEERIKKQLLTEDTGEDFDSAKLRQYQLDRLKYYYAVITCDSKETAKALYDSMDGREYLSTANFFDLRFIPDEVDFDTDTPRDECSKLPPGYKPNEFVTDALTHSKVRLTWDADDTTRKEVQKRAFSRAEIDENDLQAYIGSDSDSDEDEDSKAETQRQKMRAALGLSAAVPSKSSSKKEDGPVGDMQITFTSGLSSAPKGDSVFENGPIAEESTREKYIRKEKERKARRKEKMKATRAGVSLEDQEAEAKASSAAKEEEEEEKEQANSEDPFNDPFFNDAIASQKADRLARKADRQKKRQEREAADAATAAQRAELELLMVDDKSDQIRHFDMNEIAKAEKAAKKAKKGKKVKGGAKGTDEQQQQDFDMDTQDPRFAKLFESHEFAIDPTNPRFKGTSGMKALLEEGRRKRKGRGDEGGDVADMPPTESKREKKKAKVAEESATTGDDLQKLLARVKAKTKR